MVLCNPHSEGVAKGVFGGENGDKSFFYQKFTGEINLHSLRTFFIFASSTNP
jgi:hypothetical protein